MISDCILASDNGTCKGLTKRHALCGSNLCPFYKTAEQEKKSQEYCKARLERLGLHKK